jgi:hypothetical protein
VLASERLDEEDATRREGRDQRREERPVQIVEHEDEVVRRLPQGEVGCLEVLDLGNQREREAPGDRAQRLDARRVAIDGTHERPRRREDERVPAAPACHVERPRAAAGQEGVVEEPRRRPSRGAGCVIEGARPARHAAGEMEHRSGPDLGEEDGRAPRPRAISDHEDGPTVLPDDRRRRSQTVDRQQHRTRDVPLRGKLRGRADVEDAGRARDEGLSLVGPDVLVTAGTRHYSGCG